MEAGVAGGAGNPAPSRLSVGLLLAAVLLIRIPFLDQPIQGDDDIYITEAAHAQVDPLHPANTHYIFRGDDVDLRGHSHPPLNAWPLALLVAAFGGVKEIPFHAAYIVFSLIAVWSMWSLARRFSPHPVWATLLFCAVPAFVVNGNSFEPDVPFLAFWMASIALFCSGRAWLAAGAMALASLEAYQAVFLIPVLGAYLLLQPDPSRSDRSRDRKGAFFPILTPLIVLGAVQIFERVSTGAVPAAILSGYFTHYGFQDLENKLRNAAALAIHFCFIVFPALLPGAAMLVWRRRSDRDTQFLLAWIAIFFAGAVIVFFAGSARYLLPIAAPVALLVSRLRPRSLAFGFVLQMALSLGLAAMNYQHWDGYRQFAAALPAKTAGHRVWVDGDWGFRYYLAAQGALPLAKTQTLRPGDVVVSSELSHSSEIPATTIAQAEIGSSIPLRIIGIGSHSGFSSSSAGLWPFGISNGPIDRIRAVEIGERHITLEFLSMDAPVNAPQAAEQIVSGIYADRWMGKAGVVALKSPHDPRKLRVVFYLQNASPPRTVRLLLDGREVASGVYSEPGLHTLESPPVQAAGATATVEIDVDHTFFAPGDARALGIVLTAVGFPP
jgi:hypothetical protein